MSEYIEKITSDYDKLLADTFEKHGITSMDYNRITALVYDDFHSLHRKTILLDGNPLFTIVRATMLDDTKVNCRIWIEDENGAVK